MLILKIYVKNVFLSITGRLCGYMGTSPSTVLSSIPFLGCWFGCPLHFNIGTQVESRLKVPFSIYQIFAAFSKYFVPLCISSSIRRLKLERLGQFVLFRCSQPFTLMLLFSSLPHSYLGLARIVCPSSTWPGVHSLCRRFRCRLRA